MKEGWICPRCGKVNAPFILKCDCKPDEIVSNAYSECLCDWGHHWRIMNIVSDGITYICDKCGTTKKVYNSEIT